MRDLSIQLQFLPQYLVTDQVQKAIKQLRWSPTTLSVALRATGKWCARQLRRGALLHHALLAALYVDSGSSLESAHLEYFEFL